MGRQTDDLILNSEFLFFHCVEFYFVGVGPVFFLFNSTFNRLMLRFQGIYSFDYAHG